RLPDLSADRDPKPPPPLAALVGAAEGVEDEEAVAARAPLPVDAVKVPASGRAPAPGRPGGIVGGHYGVSRLRPFWRRRFRIARPERVLLRARKPWVRARL